MDDIDELIERATASVGDGETRYQIAKRFPTLQCFDLNDARAILMAGYKKGCEDTRRDVSDGELMAQMLRRGHIKLTGGEQ